MNQERIEQLKKGLVPKEKALEKLEPFEKCEELYVGGATAFKMSPDEEGVYVVTQGKNEYAFDAQGLEKVSRLIGIPSSYTEKVPSDLLLPHLDYWFREGDFAAKAFIRPDIKDKGGRTSIVGFASRDAFYYPVSRFLSQIDKIRPDYLVEGLGDISWRNSTFGLVFPDSEFFLATPANEIKKGDHLYGGIKIKYSMLGETPIKISSFLLTLVCLNGMVSVDEIRTYNRRQGSDGIDAWIGVSLDEAMHSLQSEVAKVRELVDLPISPEEIVPFVTHVFDQRGVPQRIRTQILEVIVEQSPRNLYELMNSITATTHRLEKRHEVYDVQALGGYITSHASSCNVCHRPF